MARQKIGKSTNSSRQLEKGFVKNVSLIRPWAATICLKSIENKWWKLTPLSPYYPRITQLQMFWAKPQKNTFGTTSKKPDRSSASLKFKMQWRKTVVNKGRLWCKDPYRQKWFLGANQVAASAIEAADIEKEPPDFDPIELHNRSDFVKIGGR